MLSISRQAVTSLLTFFPSMTILNSVPSIPRLPPNQTLNISNFSCFTKKNEKQRRKGKIQPSECRVPKTSKERYEAFLSDQCKEMEENNRMGKTRDLCKKIRDTKGTFHAKMGTIKDRNNMDLTEAEDIKKRWQEYTGELYKKYLNDPDNQNGVITHLQPDIPECEVKGALGSIPTKLVEVMEFQLSYYKS